MGSRVILNFLLNEKPTDLHVRTHAFYFLKHLQKKREIFVGDVIEEKIFTSNCKVVDLLFLSLHGVD